MDQVVMFLLNYLILSWMLSGGTQEEILFGMTPEACPAVLICPTLQVRNTKYFDFNCIKVVLTFWYY